MWQVWGVEVKRCVKASSALMLPYEEFSSCIAWGRCTLVEGAVCVWGKSFLTLYLDAGAVPDEAFA